VIGVKLPARFLLVGPPNLDLDRVERVPVRIPNRSENECIRLRLRIVTASRTRKQEGQKQT